MTNYKQLCADLVAWAEKASAHYYSEPGVLIRARTALAEPEPPSLKELVERARTALAEPEPEDPTDAETMELMPQQIRDDLFRISKCAISIKDSLRSLMLEVDDFLAIVTELEPQ